MHTNIVDARYILATPMVGGAHPTDLSKFKPHFN